MMKILYPHRDYLVQKYAKDTLSHDFEQLKLDYFDGFKHFLGNSHNLIGLDSYTHSCFTQGTTESFTHFYIRYRNKNRLRLARGEYFYHQMIKSMYYPMRFDWLEDDELKQGDVLVISAPFSDTCDYIQILSKYCVSVMKKKYLFFWILPISILQLIWR